MKKKSILVGLLAAGAVIALASCGAKQPVETSTSTQTATAKNLGQKVKVTFMNTDPYDETKKEEKEVTLDKVDASTNTAYGVVEAPKPTNPYKKFSGWYKDAELTNPANVSAITAEATFYGKWEPLYEEAKLGVGSAEGLTSWLAVAQAGGATSATADFTLTSDIVSGPITFCSNGKSKIELSKSTVNFNTQKANIKVTLSGAGTNNEIHGTGLYASSSGSARVMLYSVAEDGTETLAEQTDEFTGNNTPVEFNWTGLAKGNYVIKINASVRIQEIYTVSKLEKSRPSGIALESGAVSEYLIGSSFDKAGLVVKQTFENGTTAALDLDDINVDLSAVNFNEAGEYTVSYTQKDTTFAAVTQKVRVYAVEELVVEDYLLDSSRQTCNLEKLFVKGGTFTHANLAVTAKGKVTVDGTEKTKDFALKTSEFTVSSPDLSAAGEKTVTVTFAGDTTKTVAYKIQVVESKLVAEENTVAILVDPEAAIEVDGQTAVVNTINQALQLLAQSKLKDSVNKSIAITPGEYKEKLEFNLPNTVVYNATLIDPRSGLVSDFYNKELAENEEVVIWYDALNGKTDNNGASHSTDGSASVSVRKTATNFNAIGVTFKNYYNTHELYTASKAITGNTQAVALLVEADKAAFINCALTSYHDTLYARDGRQLYLNCYIEGRTDYIFGDKDVTAYFNGCTIHTLGANQDKNGGYVACNKGSKVNYAYIFDNCTFDADEATSDGKGVANATVSLGRTWDEGMRLVIMNSTISAAYAKADFGATTEGGKNTRYTEMNKNKSPVKANIFEYNNTGEGALSVTDAASYTSVSVLETISEAQASYVSNSFAKLFSDNGTKERGMTWVPEILGYPTDMTTTPITQLYQALNLELEVANVSLTSIDLGMSFGLSNVVGGKLTLEGLQAALSNYSSFDGYTLDGVYTDRELTTAYTYGTLTADPLALYIKVSQSSLVAKTYNFDDFDNGDITTEVKLGGANSIITLVGDSSKKFTVDENVVEYTVDGKDAVESVKRLKTNGASDANGRYIKIDLSAFTGKAKIEIFVVTGSNGSERTGKVRVDSVTGASVLDLVCPVREAGDAATNQNVTVDCGHVYYITADASINYYAIAVSPVEE